MGTERDTILSYVVIWIEGYPVSPVSYPTEYHVLVDGVLCSVCMLPSLAW